MSSVLAALIGLALVSQPAQRRVLIRDLDFDRHSDEAAEQATHAIFRQLGTRPDLITLEEPADGEPTGADVELDGGVVQTNAGWLAVLIASDGASGRPISGDSCRAADQRALTACLLQAADRAVRVVSGEPPVGRAGGSISVNSFNAYKVSEKVARNLTGVARIELQRIGGLRIVADKADWEVRGTVGILDDTWIVHLMLLDPEGKVVHTVSEVFAGAQIEMIQAVRLAARRLVGTADGKPGKVAVIADVENAQLSIDGAPPQPFSREQKLSLDPGRHRLELKAEGHHPTGRDFYVLPGQTTTLQTSLREIPEPWYTKWWIWTATGVALVAVVSVVAYASANQPDDALIEVRIR